MRYFYFHFNSSILKISAFNLCIDHAVLILNPLQPSVAFLYPLKTSHFCNIPCLLQCMILWQHEGLNMRIKTSDVGTLICGYSYFHSLRSIKILNTKIFGIFFEIPLPLPLGIFELFFSKI